MKKYFNKYTILTILMTVLLVITILVAIWTQGK
jgi:hypothetical protein